MIAPRELLERCWAMLNETRLDADEGNKEGGTQRKLVMRTAEVLEPPVHGAARGFI